MEKLITKIANIQAFKPEDRLGRMLKKYDQDELFEESLDQVFAARKDAPDYAEFLRFARERDNKRK